MALPNNVTTLVVRGTYLTPEGQPSTGSVTFTPSRWLQNSGADVAIPNSTVTATLGTAGEFQLTLPVTDDLDLQPANWFYTVSELVDGVSQSYELLLPGTAGAGGTVFLADLAPAGELGPEFASTQGPQGLAATVTVGTVTSVSNAGTAEVINSGTSGDAIFDFVLRDGPTGSQGIQGEIGPVGTAATVTVGTVGATAFPGPGSVTNSGTSGAAVLDFVLVTGEKGDTGDTGNTGPQGPAATLEVGTVTTGTAGATASVTNTGTTGSAVLDFLIPRGDKGDTGDTGPAATIAIGSVTSVAFGGTAAVTNVGSSTAGTFDFTVVTGPQGAIGDLTAAAPISYIGNEFGLNVGDGLEVVGTALAVDYSATAAVDLGTAAVGTAIGVARGDHAHNMPSASDVGAVGTATTITAGTGLVGGGDLSASRTIDADLSDANAADLGSAAAGTATTIARADHVHPTTGVVTNSTISAPNGVASLDGSAQVPAAELGNAVTKAEVTAKGDLIVASGNATIDNLPVGANDTIAIADSAQTLGIKWASLVASQIPSLTSSKIPGLDVNAQADSYTLVLGDAGKVVEMGKATAQTLTVPPNSSVALPVGTKIDVIQTGAGETTIAAGSGVTINSEGVKLKINAQWQAATLVKRATDSWVLIGALKA